MTDAASHATPTLLLEGLVARPLRLAFEDLAALDSAYQVVDVSRLDPKRQGDAVTLAGLLDLAGIDPRAKYLGLHSPRDDFHASLPLAPILSRAILIYRVGGAPLSVPAGGPFRFFIPDFAACHTHEIDECANVKFVERIELTAERGFDNRPHDGASHAALHAAEEKRHRA